MRSRRQDRSPAAMEDHEPGWHSPSVESGNHSSHSKDKDNHQSVTTISHLRLQRNALLAICILLSAATILIQCRKSPQVFFSMPMRQEQHTSSGSDCVVDLGTYNGPRYHSIESGMMGEPKCLLNSKWISVSLHTVQFPGSDSIYDDWMWIDYHDRINVLVEDERKDDEERHFLVFEQTKYALEGKTSWAIIGGIIEPGEEPEAAARREVQEEMNGITCQKFHFLGRYRTDVNRGMGWLNSFLATQCSKPRTHEHQPEHAMGVDEVGVADTEAQKLKSVTLKELKEAASNGLFMEVQWTATVAQALLHPELS
ncbi:NUDIX family hydrolase [Nitzschia inconspicua]|uniref:NUDIX family hydrolase n=1 Tax=Nitzschia inconspicua TaxID=303405 RepID=A0A9K3PQG2_9STRA|nr:NUDIX family hydrolase [Nitzschia inconspicua]